MAPFSHYAFIVSAAFPEVIPMKWSLLNALGGLAWLGGLEVAKGTSFPIANIPLAEDHRLLYGMAMGLVGLMVLVWANLRSPA